VIETIGLGAIFVGGAVVLFVGAIRLGILVAPRVERMFEEKDEEPSDRED
jgi:hypothetical protein